MLVQFFTWILVIAVLIFAGDTLGQVLKQRREMADCAAYGGTVIPDGLTFACRFELRRPD